MKTLIAIFVVGIVAFSVCAWVFPKVLKFAKKHGIVDNPNARKLQRVPVPVMGGVAVYAGLLMATIALISITHNYRIVPIIGAMTVMLIIGVWDDIKNLPATFRFLIEIALVWGLMAAASASGSIWKVPSAVFTTTNFAPVFSVNTRYSGKKGARAMTSSPSSTRAVRVMVREAAAPAVI